MLAFNTSICESKNPNIRASDSMIQLLRNQLEQLEKPEEPTLQNSEHQLPNDESTVRGVHDTQNPSVSRPTPSIHSKTTPQSTVSLTREIDVGQFDTTFPPTGGDLLHDNENGFLPTSTPVLPWFSETPTTSPEEARTSNNLERMMKPIMNQIADGSGSSTMEPFNASLPSAATPSMVPTAIEAREHQCQCDILLDARQQGSLPLRRNADTLVERYFSRHNIGFPVLHERTFRRQYERLWDSAPAPCCGLCRQRSQGKLLLPTIYALFAYTSLFEINRPEQNTLKAKSFFCIAQDVNLLEVLNDEVGLELIQWLLLTGKYLQSTEQLSKFENISNLTIRMAQIMGLHYSVGEAQRRGLLSNPATQIEREMRARVWCGCVLLQRYVVQNDFSMSRRSNADENRLSRDIPLYLCSGRSIGGLAGEENSPIPAAIDDDRLSEDFRQDNEQPAELSSSLEPFIATIKLHEILHQALINRDSCNSAGAAPTTISSVQSLLRYDTQLDHWRDALPENLRFVSSVSDVASAALTTHHDFDSVPSMPAKKLQLRYVVLFQPLWTTADD